MTDNLRPKPERQAWPFWVFGPAEPCECGCPHFEQDAEGVWRCVDCGAPAQPESAAVSALDPDHALETDA